MSDNAPPEEVKPDIKRRFSKFLSDFKYCSVILKYCGHYKHI